MKKLAFAAALVAASTLSADVVVVFDESLDVFEEQTSSAAETYELVSGGSNPFGTGNALRITDLVGGEDAELKGVKVYTQNALSPITGPVQVSFQLMALDFGGGGSSDSIKFRMGNADGKITSSGNAAVSLEPRMNGDFVVKSGDGDFKGGSGFISLNTGYTINILANFDPSAATTYSFGDQADRELGAQHYDVFVNDVLLNTGGPELFQGGTFVAESGFSAIGFMTDSHRIGGDWIIDNVYIGHGADFATQLVPEPSTYAALLGLGVLAYAFQRRRKSTAGTGAAK